ncbi:MAG: hypothetical protein ACK5LC_14430 [Coprobacillaceae bacterium]
MAFNSGDTATAAQSIKLELDLLKDGNFEVVCVNSLSEALNYSTETWYDFCSNGFSSSAVTSIDPEWSSEMVLRYEESSVELAKLRYNIGSINNVPMRITNTLLNEVLEVPVSITSFELTYVAEELQKASFALKPFKGAPVVTTPIPTP